MVREGHKGHWRWLPSQAEPHVQMSDELIEKERRGGVQKQEQTACSGAVGFIYRWKTLKFR